MKMTQSKEYYVISVMAEMAGLHPQTLRYYERMGILHPSRSQGNIRLYSREDVERVKRIKTLTQDMGVNLAGVEIILNLTEQMEKMKIELMKEKEFIKDRIRK
jgi:MerR family transcriptional regulator/heat shock protein HspR